MDELLTQDEMARADAAAIAGGIPGLTLMEAAGRAVARAVMRRFRPVRTLVLAGPGNNGGDGYVIARLLDQAGWPVAVAALAPPRPGSDAAAVAARWRGPMVAFSAAEAARAGLVVDAVFGAGLSKPVAGLAASVLGAVAAPVVAVDVPSGVDGATGAVRGFARPAALTVTFFRLKPGHLLHPGRGLCGEVVLADIGLPASVLPGIAPRAFRNAPGLWRLPRPGAEAHKYARGHVAVVAGAGMTGAARLVARAARRAGAGLLTMLAPDAATAAVLRAGDPGVMVSEGALAALLADPRIGTWVVGPGLPPDGARRALLRQVVDAGRQVVADAGALRAAAGDPAALAGCAVLTPHAGEFSAVFGPPGEDRPAAARAAAARTGAVVVLKGADSLIAAPDGRIAINANAPPWLASGGTGDVLAGIVAGLLAQGMPPFEAACAACFLHGECAARIGPGLVAEDIADHLPPVLAARLLDAAGASRAE
ncbi:NAD(P)H-hydrate dehydratase [Falsiroseomonas stagni]|uniref:Bifunctional NAD(P)H-hydrate repair enzyme n=1 Tax=Falsiroseomonas stagni DSM 19981 TaxID=1123062 RepID=A0A1I4BFL0_9PROT|nr:NAD(P)H-hydrate dehydratase [Falsiroseomonas stagni]SFK67548.1 yjeF C-terminal region, hydroxyethylthiazole kinase-related/yjeF N-terminal region [Falsiroseomonas stagni DSM 19981]